jgi:diadenosine tetraphosphate (Ap4A) HIT family hydrolase
MGALREVPAGSPSYLLAAVDGFRILSDNAPLVPGHVLIVPDEHAQSASTLEPSRLTSAGVLVQRLRDAWTDHFDAPALVFEHGTGGHDHGLDCCLDHVHLHLLPAAARIDGWFLEKSVPVLTRVSSLTDLAGVAGRGYVLVWGAHGAGWAWDATGLPSQICRRLLGEHAGDGMWNWQDRILLSTPTEYLALITANRAAALEALAPLDLSTGVSA